MADVVVDASAVVDFLLGESLGQLVEERLAGEAWHVPAHLEAEVLSALGRLHRTGRLDAGRVRELLAYLARAPIERHAVDELLLGAWERRHQLRLTEALYVELAAVRGARLVTTDRRLRPVPLADVVEV